MTIKAVLFDFGNTLVYQNPYKAFQKILGAHGIIRTTKEIEEAHVKAGREFDINKHSRLSSHEFYTQLNMCILRHLEIENVNSLQALAEDIDIQWFKVSEICVYRDVKPTLTRLKKMGFKLGLVTDGYRSDLEKILPKAGLQKFFDVCVCGDTLGKRKPDPQVFKFALDQLNIRAPKALFIGDRLDTDYLGAERVGMLPILIRRESNQQKVAGVRCITSLEEIFEILEEMAESKL